MNQYLKFQRSSLLLLFCAIISLFQPNRISASHNIILIIADDLSPDYLGAFANGTDTATAPNISALIRSGIKFTNVWATPVCSPSRAEVFTGRYPFRTGVGAVVVNTASAQLDTAEWSIAKLLKWYAPQKYNTANVGKWHLHAASINQRLYPNKMGYDFYAGNFSGALNDYYYYPIIINGQVDTVKKYATTQTVDHAIGWLDTMNAANPFFLWLAFNAPHSPFHLPPSSLCNTSGLSGNAGDITQNPQKYFKAAIEAMDTEIGRMLQYLKNKNKLDSTIIIFMGDNGNETKVAQISDKNKAKATLYDYGVHVPLSITGPGVISRGRTCNQLVNVCDLFPTIAELAGFSNWRAAIPSSKIVDGRSLLPIIKNNTTTIRDWIFSEQFNNPPDTADGKTIRNVDYHLIRWDNGKEAFYHIVSDLAEDSNKLLMSNGLSAIEKSNYNMLCDSLNKLIGSALCTPKNTSALYRYSINKYESFFKIEQNLLICNQPENLESFYLCNALGALILKGKQEAFHLNRNIILETGLYFIRFTDKSGNVHYQKIYAE